jgi:superfamily II RNA helicase
MSAPLSRKNLPENPSPDDILNAFLDYLTATDTEPYDHQEEAILELFAGNNVILNTPTGSGKSLVALALQFKSLCQGRRSYYTVPIKALANEKFLSLCHVLGPENVGMITGDATVNHDAPVICCTAEILANIALRDGANAPVDDFIMDEFHYYSDHSRGAAWQIPLLTLPRARFLLMSATLGVNVPIRAVMEGKIKPLVKQRATTQFMPNQ